MYVNPRIRICRTEGEWKEIDSRLKQMNRQNVKKYIHYEIIKLCDKFKDCQECITSASGTKVHQQFCVSQETHKTLNEISKIMNKPISSIIDDFFITPLLMPK